MNEKNLDNDIKVSVIVITYNHEKYIRQALDSILMQKVDFKYEVLIGDDASIDSTPEILKEYEEKYPDIIKPYIRKKNLGGTRNSYELFIRAKGDYIAILEGDDYWIADDKLQKQADFLEKNRKFGGITCRFHCVNEHGEMLSENTERMVKSGLYEDNKVYTIKDYERGILPGHAGTLTFRNVFKTQIDTSILYKAHWMIGDFTIALFILSMGPIYRLPEYMSVYRKNTREGDGWSVRGGSVFTFYEVFDYHSRLEQYALKKLNARIHEKTIKKRMLFSFASDCFRDPNRAKRRCLMGMLKKTIDKPTYLQIVLEAKLLSKIPPSVLTMDIDEWLEIRNTYFTNNTWKDFYEIAKGKAVICYGASRGCEDFLAECEDIIRLKYIVDNNPKKQGDYYHRVKIVGKDILKNVDKESTVIVVTPGRYVREIMDDLRELGFKNVFSSCYMELDKPSYKIVRKLLLSRDYIRQIS